MKAGIPGIVLFFLLLSLTAGAAAEPGVSIRLDRPEATLTDAVRMEVTVSGARSTSTQPVIHGLEDFTVTRGGTSSQMEFINGKMNARAVFTYFLQPQKTGTFQVGPVEMEIKGRVHTSNSAKLVVTGPRQASGGDRDAVFMEAAISSAEIYVSQQAVYTLKFYSRLIVNDLSLALPEVENVVAKQLGQPMEYQTTVAGTTYQVLEIRYVLTASKGGEYTFGPSRMNMTVRQRDGQSRFDDFFKDPFFKNRFPVFSSGRPLTVAAPSLALTVRDLPEQGKPPGFSGLVGDFQVASRLDPASLAAGASATLTITVSGRGNVNRIPDLLLADIPFTRTYGDQPVLETEQDDTGIGGTKTMKWALVPEKAGQLEIPSQTLSYFDPDAKEYIVLQTPVHTLTVTPGDSRETSTPPASSGLGETVRLPEKNGIEQIGQDILPIQTTVDDLSSPNGTMVTGWRFWAAAIGPLSIYLLLLAGIKLRHRSPERSAQQRSRRAFRALTRRCRQDRMGSADLIDALTTYVNDRFDLSVGTLTADEAEKLVLSKGAGPESAHRLRSLIRQLEGAVYAGAADKHTDAAGGLLAIVKAVEKEIG